MTQADLDLVLQIGEAVVDRQRFLGTMEALRDLLNATEAHLAVQDADEQKLSVRRILERTFADMPKAELLATQGPVTEWFELMTLMAARSAVDPHVFDGDVADAVGSLNRSLLKVDAALGDRDRLVSLVLGLGAGASRPPRTVLLGQALVIAAVSAYERYLIGVAKAVLRRTHAKAR